MITLIRLPVLEHLSDRIETDRLIIVNENILNLSVGLYFNSSLGYSILLAIANVNSRVKTFSKENQFKRSKFTNECAFKLKADTTCIYLDYPGYKHYEVPNQTSDIEISALAHPDVTPRKQADYQFQCPKRKQLSRKLK